MTPYVENKLPQANKLVKLFIGRKDNTPTVKIGYWYGSEWYYVTNPPSITSFSQDNVIGWEEI